MKKDNMAIELSDTTLIAGVMRSVAEFVDSIAPFPSDRQYDLHGLASAFPHRSSLMADYVQTMPRAYLRGHGARQQEFDDIVRYLYDPDHQFIPEQAWHAARYELLEIFANGRTIRRTSQEAMNELFRLKGRWWLLNEDSTEDYLRWEYPVFVRTDNAKQIYDRFMAQIRRSYLSGMDIGVVFSVDSPTGPLPLISPYAWVSSNNGSMILIGRNIAPPGQAVTVDSTTPLEDLHTFLARVISGADPRVRGVDPDLDGLELVDILPEMPEMNLEDPQMPQFAATDFVFRMRRIRAPRRKRQTAQKKSNAGRAKRTRLV